MIMATPLRDAVIKGIESARSKAACFADKPGVCREIERELRALSELFGPHRQTQQQRTTIDDIWDAATNSVCQTMQDRNMCKCPDGDCLAAKINPEPADYSRYICGDPMCHQFSKPNGRCSWCKANIAPKRRPIVAGAYGAITISDEPAKRAGARVVYVSRPWYGMTADELREAAHLFNQLAETLEQ